jgi:hypothetical protein
MSTHWICRRIGSRFKRPTNCQIERALWSSSISRSTSLSVVPPLSGRWVAVKW